jgi:hypothetical protein
MARRRRLVWSRGVRESRITVCSVAFGTSVVSAIDAPSMPILNGILNP